MSPVLNRITATVILTLSLATIRSKSGFEYGVETFKGEVITFDVETGKIIARKDKYAALRQSQWFKENQAWVTEYFPGLVGKTKAMLGRQSSQRTIWVGSILPRSTTATDWSVQLGRRVQLAPIEPGQFLYMAYSRGGLPCPGSNEVWAFSGTLRSGLLTVKSAQRFAQYEIGAKQPAETPSALDAKAER